MSVKKRIRELESRGYVVVKTKGQHLKLTRPGFTGMVFTGSTPSDGARGGKEIAPVMPGTRKVYRPAPTW